MKQTSNSIEQTQKIADEFIKSLDPSLDPTGQGGAVVVGLYGNLGAGKTTLTQCIAKALGVEETVNSPTFVLEKIYLIPTTHNKLFTNLIHIDAYRIEKSDELLHLGWEEIIADPKNLILIEWPERVTDIMPPHIKINLSHISENSREIEIL